MENDYWICPHCGEELKPDAKFCPFCGSDENTGWSEDTYLDGADWRHDDWSPVEEDTVGKINSLWGIVIVVIVVIGVLLSTLL